ncbi:MAG: DNA polymerase III subunit delta [Dehalococcoidia bacterium]|nr:MAG: DNA polymerase III subunit delta [Dehalococcoidia bacterium]
MLHIFYGEDDFSLTEALTELKRGLGDEGTVAANTTVLQGQNTTPAELIATCDTIPFLAPYRLVIVEGLLGQFEQQGRVKRPKKSNSSSWFALIEYVGQIPESTILVLVDGGLKKSNPLLKELLPHAKVREFKPLNGSELFRWMDTRARMYGGNMSNDAARLLHSIMGSNLWLMANEIDKLCTYATGRSIEKDDVELLAADFREPNVFAMIDSILERRSAAATRLLHRLEEEGAAPPYLIFMITRQFRLVIQAKDLLQQRRKASDIGGILGINRDYALRKTLEQARAYSMERLKDIYRKLLETDISIKTGRFRDDKGELALDLLISELCEYR